MDTPTPTSTHDKPHIDKENLTRTYAQRQKHIRVVVWSVVGVALVSLCYLFYLRESQLEIALEWSCMAPLPQSAYALASETTGSMFTREFLVSFKASEADIRAWLAVSPGVQGQVMDSADSVMIYSIKPCEGAQFAQVLVNWKASLVIIRAYWS
jgi:hypothetical protein